MNTLSLILLLSFAVSPIIAMRDGGEEIAPPAYQYPQFYQPAFAAPAQAAGVGMSPINNLNAINDNNNQLLMDLMAQNSPLVNLCLSNQRMLSALIAFHNSAPAAIDGNSHSQQNRNLLRAQQALARAEQEDAPKRIDAVLLKAEQLLKDQLVTTKQSGHDMMRVTVKLRGKELRDEIDKYVARMSAVESSLMEIMGDQYISEVQSDKALKFLEQARHQAQEAQRAELVKQSLSWADLNAQ